MNRVHKTNQAGMVAIIVTMIMMFVITLIVLGFSENTRRNQREALDTQLGTQAYYAAETGVNDVVNLLKAGEPLAENTECSFTTSNGSTYPRSLKGAGPTATVANTCLMVDPYPSSLIAGNINPNSDSVQWDVKNKVPGQNFTKFKFSWKPDKTQNAAPGITCLNTLGAYSTVASWNCAHALVRVDIIPVTTGMATDAASLANLTSTFYMQPTNVDTNNVIAVTNFGSPAAHQGGCQPNGGVCTIIIDMSGAASAKGSGAFPTCSRPPCPTNSTGGGISDEFYIRLTSQYVAAENVTLTASDDANPIPGIDGSQFANGQVLVDSTGRAQDQLKRIQVRVPLTSSTLTLPVFGVQSSNNICKSLRVAPAKVYENSCPDNWPNI